MSSSQSKRSDGALRFVALKRQAEEKVLLVSPPYATDAAQKAFVAGYETALRDIADGWLKP